MTYRNNRMAMREHCRHYHGDVFLRRADCHAGINVRNLVGGDDHGWFNRAPCCHPENAITCPQRQELTTEEIALREARFEAAIERMTLAGPVIQAARERLKGGGLDTVECPVCKGNLHISIAAYNGHCHGQCETEGCLRWME
jgi:hypothetical protein